MIELTEELERKIYQVADHYDEESQTDMLIEEMSELTKALLKNRRAQKGYTNTPVRQTVYNIEEEIADVIVMLIQIVYLGDFEDIEEIIEEKLDRQLDRIAKEQ